MLFGKKKKILFVDDDENIKATTSFILESWGLDVLTAANGQEALSLIRNEDPDLVLLDINMPGIKGYDICKLAKSDPKTRKIPIILMTGLGKTKEVDQGYSCGADDYMIKPVDMDRLKSKISSVLNIKIN